MGSQDQSEDIKWLTSRVVKVLVQRTGGDPRIAIKFVNVYGEACRREDSKDIEEYDESNLEIRRLVRDNLLKKGLIFVDPKDVESIMITRKAIDEYSNY